jgi:hypothetical protein
MQAMVMAAVVGFRAGPGNFNHENGGCDGALGNLMALSDRHAIQHCGR